MNPPKELFLTLFPCGAFKTSRTQGGAKLIGLQIAGKCSCCEQGHDSFEIHLYEPIQKL